LTASSMTSTPAMVRWVWVKAVLCQLAVILLAPSGLLRVCHVRTTTHPAPHSITRTRALSHPALAASGSRVLCCSCARPRSAASHRVVAPLVNHVCMSVWHRVAALPPESTLRTIHVCLSSCCSSHLHV
jgi:hypothetical protein